MEQQDQPNKKPRIALCTEFGGGQWRMLFLDTLEQCKMPHFLGAKQGKWFEQSEDGKWQQVEPKELADFDVRLDGLDEWCCLKIRMPVFFPQRFGFMDHQHCNGSQPDTFISPINQRILGKVHVDIGDRKRQTVHYWAYVSLTSFNSTIAEDDGGGSNLQWSIRSEADILGPYEQLDMRKSSPEATMKIQPYQPNWICQDANQQQMMEITAPTNDQQNDDARPKKSKAPKELEEKQHEALVLCWKQSSEDSFFCQWNPSTEQFMINRRFQASNKLLNDAELDIQLGDWYQIRFVKYKKSNVHISIVGCEEILVPFNKHIQDRIIQLFPDVIAINSILKKMSKENQQQPFGGTVQQRPLSRAESIQGGQQEIHGWTKRRPEDLYSVSEPPDDDEKVQHVPRSLNSVQLFALSAPDSTRKRSMAPSRAYTPARLTPIQKAAPKTYRHCLDVPKQGIHDYVPVEEKYFERFLRANAQVIQELKEEHPNCKIFLDRNNKCFKLEAKTTADVDAAKRRIQEILDALVDISVQKPQDGKQHTVALTVRGTKEMVERCVAFIEADMPISKIVNLPQEFRDHFLGNGGQLMQQMQKQHGVQIHFAPRVDCSDVTVVGEAAHVDTCIRAIHQKVAEILAEKNSALSRATTSNVRAAASMAGSNGIHRSASTANCFQSRGNEWRH